MPTICTLFSQNMYMQSFLFSESVSNSTNFLDNRVIEISIDLYEQYFTELSLLQKNQNGQTFHSPWTCPQMSNGTDFSTRDLIIRGRQSKNHLNVNLFISLEYFVSAIQSSQLCLTLCYPMEYSTPGFPVHHQLLELTQTHVQQVGDAIQSSCPLSSSSPPSSIFPSMREISPEYSLEGLMLKLKLQYFGHLMQKTDSLEKIFVWVHCFYWGSMILTACHHFLMIFKTKESTWEIWEIFLQWILTKSLFLLLFSGKK